ncbi:BPSS1780 family membrane protein [Xenorhabdus szentirmaii]|uniref:BPSS1780 family membrane protein n=1 Tax=Xenorhabdus szentirmaii TaxID=290112 RepID=UPI0032B80854
MDTQEINPNSEENNISLNKEKDTFIPGGRAAGAGASIEWIADSWNLFKAQPMKWFLLFLAYTISWLALTLVGSIIALIISPFIFAAMLLLIPVFTAGFAVAAEEQRNTGNFQISSLFAGFKKNFGSLIAVGALLLGLYIIGVVVMVLTVGLGVLQLFFAVNNSDLALLGTGGLTTMLLSFVITIIFSIAALAISWFSPSLIMINNLKFTEAISMSLSAIKKNLLGGFIFFILMGIIMQISAIPLGLGLLITMPIYMAAYYTTYRSVFYAPAKKEPSSGSID